MFNRHYSNFVQSFSFEPQSNPISYNDSRLTGEEARKLYLEEVQTAWVNDSPLFTNTVRAVQKFTKRKSRKPILDEEDFISNTNLFLSAQNNDLRSLNEILNTCPDKLNAVDGFGWSLLMVACQANSVEVVKELLKRGIDITIKDKVGNSARKLVIKNKNFILAGILLNPDRYKKNHINTIVKVNEEYTCEICNNRVFPDKLEHLSSIVHNINVSKDKKVQAKFMIPPSNIGYQIMLKEGWDNQSGLGKDGTGNKYPVKAVQKLDRQGLGLKRSNPDKTEPKSAKVKLMSNYENKKFEINFRREFY